ncbi:MAG: 2,3-bisphosphoglycerate-independent phosphoglycerate mutase [candidate division SR1 bacterium]|nr:2,3-bisphosphoglycerate-independent phosphoglycerate mutase [candidate division SR1 bacterium]
MKKLALIILDGFGINTKTPAEDAITLAKSPTFTALFQKLTTQLDASGEAVGLPEGQMGNSEVGHMTIGTGRINKQYPVQIEDMLNDGSFAKLAEFKKGIDHCKKNKSHLHLLQIFGNGGVHAFGSHLQKIIALIPKDVPTFLHLFTDGRDSDPHAALEVMKDFQKFLQKFPHVVIASMAGRYYGMDRDNNRERIQKSYDEIMFGQLQTSDTPCEYLAKQYELGLTDEFLPPVCFMDAEQVEDGDTIFHLNFRSDRGRQMTQAIMVSCNPKVAKDYPTRPGNGWTLKNLRNIYFATMTKYYKEYDGNLFIKPIQVVNTLGEVISKNEGRQLRIAETEKFPHVTKFFNGDKYIVYDGEKDIIVPSHKVATYDLDPDMSAEEITNVFLKDANDYEFVAVNLANGDMVGHTGVLAATEQAIKKMDQCVAEIISFCKKNKFDLLITADHGNCEVMGTKERPMTYHTSNLVPFRYLSNGEVVPTKARGGLADVAPTVLKLMGLAAPKEMTGKSLV